MEGRAAWGRLRRHLDSERTHARQAEARLRLHLQRLERACRSHLRLLSWEQRQLRRELERLQRNIKSKCPASSGGGFQPRPADQALRPAREGRRGGAPRASGLRAPGTASQNGSREPPSRPASPKDPVGSEEPSPSRSSAAPDAPEEHPAGRAARTEPAHAHLGAGPAGDRGGFLGEEAGSGDAAAQPDHGAGEPPSPRATGCAGDPSSEASASSLLELCARAAHARYLRHRAPPESERELSLAEIFGRGGPGAQDTVASQSPPL